MLTVSVLFINDKHEKYQSSTVQCSESLQNAPISIAAFSGADLAVTSAYNNPSIGYSEALWAREREWSLKIERKF